MGFSSVMEEHAIDDIVDRLDNPGSRAEVLRVVENALSFYREFDELFTRASGPSLPGTQKKSLVSSLTWRASSRRRSCSPTFCSRHHLHALLRPCAIRRQGLTISLRKGQLTRKTCLGRYDGCGWTANACWPKRAIDNSRVRNLIARKGFAQSWHKGS
jgi:hypothetical protein